MPKIFTLSMKLLFSVESFRVITSTSLNSFANWYSQEFANPKDVSLSSTAKFR